jgi:probable phosphoglycerate mutase
MSDEDALLPPPGLRQRGPAPSGTRIVLVRHGECVANVSGLAGGHKGDGGLTPRGRAQAEELVDRLLRTKELLDVSALYCSSLPRALETASILKEVFETPLISDAKFDEVHLGEGDGLAWNTFVERFGNPQWDIDPTQQCAPGGESLLDFYERTKGAFQWLIERHVDERIVVVSHGGFIEQAMKIALGLSAGVRMQPRIEHCSMTELEWSHNWWRLLRFNDASPLSASVLQEFRDQER